MTDEELPVAKTATATIRSMIPDDLSALKGVVDATGLFPAELLDDMAAGYLSGAAPNEFWLTAQRDGEPMALAYYVPERMTQGTWNLLLIAVHPDRQGQGIGAALMRHVEAELETLGGRVLLVETSGLPDFAATRAFYRRIGYEEEARIRDYYQAGDDKIVFRKAIA